MEELKVVTARKRRRWPWLVGALAAAIVLAGAGGVLVWQYNRTKSLVPAKIAKAVSFPVYYPDPKQLPAGYSLDTQSFNKPVKNGVTYVVTYGSGKRLVFSVQPKPGDNDLQGFISNYIPLKLDYQTNVGQAAIGAYRGQTLVSLPVIKGPWIIITGPSDVNQDQLKQVLQAIRQP